jgi:hypothetical protein
MDAGHAEDARCDITALGHCGGRKENIYAKSQWLFANFVKLDVFGTIIFALYVYVSSRNIKLTLWNYN